MELLRALLNLMCVSLSMVCKVPQLRFHINSRSTQGLSRSSLLLETFAMSVTFSYFSANGYPAADYLEYPLLLAQNVALFAMAFYFDSASVAVMAAAAVGYFAPVYLLSQGILGPSIVQLAASLALPVSSLSKVTQIVEIVRTGRGDLVSRTPWIVFAATSAARFYTVLVETADTMLLLTYTNSVVLNLLVVAVAVYYTTDARERVTDTSKKMI